MVRGVKVPPTLSPEEEEANEIIAGVRGRVEGPYGWVKRAFHALFLPFYEDEEQHDCLVWTAFACHRLMVGCS